MKSNTNTPMSLFTSIPAAAATASPATTTNTSDYYPSAIASPNDATAVCCEDDLQINTSGISQLNSEDIHHDDEEIETAVTGVDSFNIGYDT